MITPPLEIERKYLLLAPPPTETVAELASARALLEQYYIEVEERREIRLRRDLYRPLLYTLTIKRPLASGVRSERERQLSPEQAELLLRRRDPRLGFVRKQRYWIPLVGGLWCEVDYYITPSDLVVCEIELPNPTYNPPLLPECLGPYVDVTGNSHYDNASLAARSYLEMQAGEVR